MMSVLFRAKRAIAVVAAAAVTAVAIPSTKAADLTITVSGVKSSTGRIYVGVHRADSGIKFPDDKGMVAGIWREAVKGSFTVQITGFPPGRYAINGFHDQNDNGKLDTNVLGIPTEGYGFGNGADASFGPPKFEAASVDVIDTARIRLPIGY